MGYWLQTFSCRDYSQPTWAGPRSLAGQGQPEGCAGNPSRQNVIRRGRRAFSNSGFSLLRFRALGLRRLGRSSRLLSCLLLQLVVGLATDLGGYGIMVGGTNGAHLNSFSLVDLVSHGRACAILNPYYTVFFAPAVQPQLKKLAALWSKYGLIADEKTRVSGRALGEAVAEGLIALSRRVGFPASLGEIEGMDESRLDKILQAARNPQLESKLKNMPIPLTADLVDEYMHPVLRAALTGDFSLIKSLS